VFELKPVLGMADLSQTRTAVKINATTRIAATPTTIVSIAGCTQAQPALDQQVQVLGEKNQRP
jgi:hypothetical protein